MRKTQIKLTYAVSVILAVMFIITSLSGCAGSVRAAVCYAETGGINYTDVLDDLRKDEKFDISEYPQMPTDYSLQVKHIAESVNGELFIYVYQPSGAEGKLKATTINISTAIDDNLFYKNYELELLNCDGVFYKYRVNELEVGADEVRYYDISEIFREWRAGIDEDPGKDNTISEVAYAVGQRWTARTQEGEVTYSMIETEVVKVESQMIGCRRYSNGLEWSGITNCDAHYLAFSTKHKIDKLLSADIEFCTQTYKKLEGQELNLNDDKEQHSVRVTAKDKGASKKETWQRLSSVDEFIKDLEINGDEKKNLSKYDWIINFYETEYKRDVGGKDFLISLLIPFGWIWTVVNACTTRGAIVSDVTLMRLEFEYDGKIYNLGVVSNKQTGAFNPTNGGVIGFFAYVWKCITRLFTGKASVIETVVAVIAIIVALVLFVLAVKLIKWACDGLFRKRKKTKKRRSR